MSVFSYLLFGAVIQISLTSNILSGNTPSLLAQQKLSPVDSFYNQLVSNGADSILLYHELRDDEQLGLISWKKYDTLYGITFKVISGIMHGSKMNSDEEFKVKNARSLYFTNENRIADTLPHFPWGTSDMFYINIRSFQHGRERNYHFSCDQVYFGTFTISKVGKKCADLIFGY
jgi:hypothetical protein